MRPPDRFFEKDGWRISYWFGGRTMDATGTRARYVSLEIPEPDAEDRNTVLAYVDRETRTTCFEDFLDWELVEKRVEEFLK